MQEYRAVKDRLYKDYKAVYTDGSKTSAGVGAAAVMDGSVKYEGIRREASVLTAELFAIQFALTMISDCNSDKFVIFSDSLSALTLIQDTQYCYKNAAYYP